MSMIYVEPKTSSPHARTLPQDPGAGREGRTGPRLRSGPSKKVGVALCPINPLARPGAVLGRGEGGGGPRDVRVILTVDASAMHAAGHAFYQAANGVWLTDHVPPGYLSG